MTEQATLWRLPCRGAAAGVGVVSPGRFASVGASAATGGLVGMGVLGIFSIGLPLLVAAAVAPALFLLT